MRRLLLIALCFASFARAEAPRSNVLLTVGPGVSSFAGLWGATLYFGALAPLGAESPLFVGIDGAATVWSVQGANGAEYVRFTFMSLHFLPTAVYRFRLGEASSAHLGLSVGPHVFLGNFNFKTKETAEEVFQTGTGLSAEWLLRAGVHFALTPRVAMTLEPELGRLMGNYVFFPKAAFTIAL